MNKNTPNETNNANANAKANADTEPQRFYEELADLVTVIQQDMGDKSLLGLLASAGTGETNPIFSLLQEVRYGLEVLSAAICKNEEIPLTSESGLDAERLEMVFLTMGNKLEVVHELYQREQKAKRGAS